MAVPYNSDPPMRGLCRDLLTGWTGELQVNQAITLKLVRFEEPAVLACHASNRVVELEDGGCATLSGCTPAVRGFNFVEEHVNRAIFGDRAWNADDRVRLVIFSFWEARQALSYSEHLTLSDDAPFLPIVDTRKLNILEVACAKAVVKIGFAASVSFDRFKPGPSLRPSVAIEFKEPQSLPDAMYFASDVLAFFELSCGRHSRLLDVTVSSKTAQERLDSLDAANGFPVDDFKVRFPYSSLPEDDDSPRPPCALFSLYDAEHRAATADSLKHWIERKPKWVAANALFRRYIADISIFDRDRLMRLAAWFESIPMVDRKTNVTTEQKKQIIEGACVSATSVGRVDLHDRIGELLGGLRKKTLRQQLDDTHDRLKQTFGDFLPIGMRADLKHFAYIRNSAAHGRIAMSGDNAATDIRAMRAVELLCLLGMVEGLGVLPEVYGVIPSHPLGTYSVFH